MIEQETYGIEKSCGTCDLAVSWTNNLQLFQQLNCSEKNCACAKKINVKTVLFSICCLFAFLVVLCMNIRALTANNISIAFFVFCL